MGDVFQFPADRAYPGPDLARVNRMAVAAAGEKCQRCHHTRYVHLGVDGCDFAAHYVVDEECDCDGFVPKT